MNRSLRKGLCIRLAAAALAVLTVTAALGAGARTVYASEVTTMSKQNAKLKGDSINTRSGAGTNYDKVEALPGGTEANPTQTATSTPTTTASSASSPSCTSAVTTARSPRGNKPYPTVVNVPVFRTLTTK